MQLAMATQFIVVTVKVEILSNDSSFFNSDKCIALVQEPFVAELICTNFEMTIQPNVYWTSSMKWFVCVCVYVSL